MLTKKKEPRSVGAEMQARNLYDRILEAKKAAAGLTCEAETKCAPSQIAHRTACLVCSLKADLSSVSGSAGNYLQSILRLGR